MMWWINKAILNTNQIFLKLKRREIKLFKLNFVSFYFSLFHFEF